MDDRILMVVGDKFKDFAVGKDALTISQLRGLLAVPHLVDAAAGRLSIVPGQGLSEDDVAEVLAMAHDNAHAARFDLTLWRNHPARAAGARSHKRHKRNTLISEPRRTGDDAFEMDLLIDQECELMGDHQTGQHIQGMILMEAARQSFLAVTEAFFLEQDGTKYYFVIDEMAIRYKRFLFPLGASLRYAVREKDLAGSRKRFLVDIAIEQGGQEAASSTIGFTVFDAARISKREAGLAIEAFETCVGALRAKAAAGVAEAA